MLVGKMIRQISKLFKFICMHCMCLKNVVCLLNNKYKVNNAFASVCICRTRGYYTIACSRRTVNYLE